MDPPGLRRTVPEKSEGQVGRLWLQRNPKGPLPLEQRMKWGDGPLSGVVLFGGTEMPLEGFKGEIISYLVH